VLGAIVLLHTARPLMALVPWLLLLAAGLFAISGPVSAWLRRDRASVSGTTPTCAAVDRCLVVCFYIGYFGAGAGFLLMSVLAVFGIQNINQVNALKVIATTTANGIAVVTFIVEKQILWSTVCSLMIAAALAVSGARYSRGLNPRFMRMLVVGIGLGMAAYFFWKQYA